MTRCQDDFSSHEIIGNTNRANTSSIGPIYEINQYRNRANAHQCQMLNSLVVINIMQATEHDTSNLHVNIAFAWRT